MYLCGHEHVLQFKRCAGGVAQCVVGAVADTGFYGGPADSAILRQMDWVDPSRSRGFLAVAIGAAEASLQFVRAADGQVLHTVKVRKPTKADAAWIPEAVPPKPEPEPEPEREPEPEPEVRSWGAADGIKPLPLPDPHKLQQRGVDDGGVAATGTRKTGDEIAAALASAAAQWGDDQGGSSEEDGWGSD
jgi:hypothetical protein